MKFLISILLLSLACVAQLPNAPSVQNTKSDTRAWWITNGINAASVYADMGVSVHSKFQPGVGSCHETNRLYGSSYPSAKRFLVQGTTEVIGIGLVTYYLKKYHHSWFVLIPLSNSIIHTVAAINTADYCF